MKKSIILFAVASGLTLLASQSATAGNRAGAFTLTPGAAYDFFAQKRNLENAWLLPTVALGYDITENWGVEGMYSNFGASQKGASQTGNVTGNLYTLDGIYHFMKFDMLEPYLSAGLGVMYVNPNGSDAYNQADINAGLGAQLFFGESVALRGEVRDIYTMAGGENDVTLGFGVSFLMGGQDNHAPASYKGERFKDDK
jgi:OOP family OmpA-OmpF porin